MIRETDNQPAVLRFCTEHRQRRTGGCMATAEGEKQRQYHSKGVFLTVKCIVYKVAWNYFFLHMFSDSHEICPMLKFKHLWIFFIS